MNLKRLLSMLILCVLALPAFAQTPTTFTYQGRLYNNGVLANGSYVLRITPYNQLTGGSTLGPALVPLPLPGAKTTFPSRRTSSGRSSPRTCQRRQRR